MHTYIRTHAHNTHFSLKLITTARSPIKWRSDSSPVTIAIAVGIFEAFIWYHPFICRYWDTHTHIDVCTMHLHVYGSAANIDCVYFRSIGWKWIADHYRQPKVKHKHTESEKEKEKEIASIEMHTYWLRSNLIADVRILVIGMHVAYFKSRCRCGTNQVYKCANCVCVCLRLCTVQKVSYIQHISFYSTIHCITTLWLTMLLKNYTICVWIGKYVHSHSWKRWQNIERKSMMTMKRK